MRNQDKDIFVLYDDNSYKFIDNTDANILSYAKKDHVKFMFFPVYGKNSTRYYKEDAKVIISPIQITIDGQLILCNITDDGPDYGYSSKIHLESNDIASSYSLIGSLYNLELCCEELYTEYHNIEPYFINFEVRISVDGCEYKLDTELFVNSINELAESGNSYAKASMVHEADFNAIYIDELIHYIENTISYKDARYDSLNGSNEDYMIFDNDSYITYTAKTNFVTSSDKTLLLMTTGTPLYMTVLFKEYLMLCGCNRYDISYCVYAKLDLPSDEDYLDEHDINCNTLYELDGYVYDVQYDDTAYMYFINQFLFAVTGIADINDVLMTEIDSNLLFDGDISICYTCNISLTDNFAHNALISDSITSNLINTDNLDLLSMIVSDIKVSIKSRM